MVDLGGYVIIISETKDKKIKLYGSPADKADLEVGDEILEVNGKSLEDRTHAEVISHIHQCIRSRTICLRVKRRSANRLAYDLAQNSHVQDAFVIAVEAQARERLERLSALKRIKPVDMSKLSQQLNKENPSTEGELNGLIENSAIYVTSYPPPPGGTTAGGNPGVGVREEVVEGKLIPGRVSNGHAAVGGGTGIEEVEVELKQELRGEVVSTPKPPSSPFSNGGTELLIGQERVIPPSTATSTPSTTPSAPPLATPHLLEKPIDYVTRPRRRSGGVEKEGVGGESTAVPPHLHLPPPPAPLDNGPHREMPVDVPESFMPRNKTPPRYPPPRPRPQQTGLNGCVLKESSGPEVPPRDVPGNRTPPEPPTKQQLDSIRKYQDQLRKRREEEEWSNLRGSKKLAALESGEPQPQGLINQGFSGDEGTTIPPPPSPPPAQSIYTPIEYHEFVSAGERVAGCCRGLGLDGSRLNHLLNSVEFQRALSTLDLLHKAWPLLSRPSPLADNAQSLARDVLESLSHSCLPEASELTELLSGHEVEGLLWSHDAVAREIEMPPRSPSSVHHGPAPPPLLSSSVHHHNRLPAPPPPTLPPPNDEDSNIKIIKIEKTNEPLGATVRNEGESVIIGRVVRGGAAEKSGLLHEGDEVLEVNGIEMRGKSVNEVCDLLSTMTGTLTFLVIPSKNQRPHRDTLMHVKANFDYDPEDDLYIPCRELGVSFQKGDVLHVICQDDPNWWQAYREGEEDQTLAGLIPSKSFQHQRESLKQVITGDRLSKEKSKKAGTFLCAKKNTKKKKKKSPFGGYDSGCPIYASNMEVDYEAEEILTYDEVALYYPRANQKRPIVLIGPPNIGRHELRQRLMEDSERFAAAVPHTSRPRKEGEVDGTDYHFISRAQFEADILARRFVEHGEYERALYGTSVEAIRTVVAGGKICVLNLHPQSLRILRASDLKPYVVFVAPPSLEKLRQKKIRSGEAYKEEELKEIIEKAREMEDKYGHYFDMIINNTDTERAYHQLLNEINILEREPQWVPAAWLKSS